MTTLEVLGLLAGAYLIGSVPTGLWLGRLWKGVDVRQHGSGNLGATNVLRVLGPVPGITTLAIDILKGLLPVLLSGRLFPGDDGVAVAAGLAAIVGHGASAFVRFRGGKGVATSAGVCAALMPVPFAVAVGVFAVVLAASRIVSISSVLAGLALAASAQGWSPAGPVRMASILIAALIVWTHRANLRRLIQGTEPRLQVSRKPA